MALVRRRIAMVGLTAGLVGGCGDAPPPPSVPPAPQSAPAAAVPRAVRPVEPAPAPGGLDAVVGGRTIRDWIAAASAGEATSPECAAARAALRTDPQATADAVVAALREGTGADALPRLLAWLLPDVRDALVPRLLPLVEDDATRPAALSVLLVYGDARGYGPHDALVADVVSRCPQDGDTATVLGSLGAALGPVAARVIRPFGAPVEGVDASTWLRVGWTAPEAAAPLLFPRDGAEERSLGDAVDWLAWHASRIRPVVPALVARLGATSDPHERAGLLRALARTGDAGAVAAVVAAAHDPSSELRGRAAFALGESPPGAPGAVAALRALADDDDEDVRADAGRALAALAASSDEALAALSARLRSDDPSVRDAAVAGVRFMAETEQFQTRRRHAPLTDRALGTADAGTRAALLAALPRDATLFPVRAVDGLLRDPDPRVRDAARGADPRPAGATAADVGSWLELLSCCRYVGSAGAEFEDRLAAYVERGGRMDELVAALGRCLRPGAAKSAPLDARSAADVAERLGPRAAPLQAMLAARIDATPPGWEREPFLRAFAAVGGDAAAVVLPHIAGAKPRDSWTESCLPLLRPEHLPQVVAALRHADANVRRAFATALGKMADVPSESAAPPLVPLLEDRDASVRRAAAAALLRRRARTDLALGTIRRELDVWPTLDADGDVSAADRDVTDLLQALADAGPLAAPAFDVLHRGLRSPTTRAPHLHLLCRVMTGLGPAAAPAVPELTALVESRSCSGLDAYGPDVAFSSGPPPDVGYVAVAAVDALGAIGPAARSSLPALRAAASSQELRLRTAAERAIRSIGSR